jgi:hypothetical protein
MGRDTSYSDTDDAGRRVSRVISAAIGGAFLGLLATAVPVIAFIISCAVLVWLGFGSIEAAGPEAPDESSA